MRLCPSLILCTLLAACSSSSSAPEDAATVPPDSAPALDSATDAAAADVTPLDSGAGDVSSAPDGTPSADLPSVFPVGPGACMGTEAMLPQLGQTGNITIYGGCKSITGADRYLLVWGGSASALSQTDLSAIKAQHASELLGISGMQAHGITSCCVQSTNAACIGLFMAANSGTVWDLARALDPIFAGESSCFGMVADVPGDLGPRCQASDPECLPLPICDTALYFDPVCCTVPPYDASATRVPTLSSSSPNYGLEQPQSPGECSHDGECMINGCGNHCVAYTAPTQVATCPCYSELKDSFCGCVGGQCVWYEQQ